MLGFKKSVYRGSLIAFPKERDVRSIVQTLNNTSVVGNYFKATVGPHLIPVPAR